MTPIKNRHVERVLSLLVVLYGMWLLVSSDEVLVRFATTLGGNSSTILFPFLSKIVIGCCIGCCVLMFFPHIVRWAGYFATREKSRSQRHWFAVDICTLPVVLSVFAFLLSVFLGHVAVATSALFPYSCCGNTYTSPNRIGIAMVLVSSLLVYIAIAVVILLCARRIAAWLLRMAEKGGKQ